MSTTVSLLSAEVSQGKTDWIHPNEHKVLLRFDGDASTTAPQQYVSGTSIPMHHIQDPEWEHPTPQLLSSSPPSSVMPTLRLASSPDTDGLVNINTLTHSIPLEEPPPALLLQQTLNLDRPAAIWLDDQQHVGPPQSTLETTPTQSNVLLQQTLDARETKKAVRFSTMTVRHYERILGDNPSCSSGPAISIGWKFTQAPSIALVEYERGRYAVSSSPIPWSMHPRSIPTAASTHSTFRVANPMYFPPSSRLVLPPVDSSLRPMNPSMDSTRHSVGSTVSTSSLTAIQEHVSHTHLETHRSQSDETVLSDTEDLHPYTPSFRITRQANATDRCTILSRQEREDLLISLGYSRATLVDAVRQNVKVKNQRRQTVNNLKVAKAEEFMERMRKSLKRLCMGKQSRSRYLYDEWMQQQQQPTEGLPKEPTKK